MSKLSESKIPLIALTTTEPRYVSLIIAAAKTINRPVRFLNVGTYFTNDTAFVHPGQIGFEIPITSREQRVQFQNAFETLRTRQDPPILL